MPSGLLRLALNWMHIPEHIGNSSASAGGEAAGPRTVGQSCQPVKVTT
jgi:hypothetical protein